MEQLNNIIIPTKHNANSQSLGLAKLELNKHIDHISETPVILEVGDISAGGRVDLRNLTDNVTSISKEDLLENAVELSSKSTRQSAYKAIYEHTYQYSKEAQEEIRATTSKCLSGNALDPEQGAGNVLKIMLDARKEQAKNLVTQEISIAGIGESRLIWSSIKKVMNNTSCIDLGNWIKYPVDNVLTYVFTSVFKTWGISNLELLIESVSSVHQTVFNALNYVFAPLWCLMVHNVTSPKKLILSGYRITSEWVDNFYLKCIKNALAFLKNYESISSLFRSERTGELTAVIPGEAENKILEANTKAATGHTETHEKTLNAAKVTINDNTVFNRSVALIQGNLKSILGPMYENIAYPIRFLINGYSFIKNFDVANVIGHGATLVIMGTAVFTAGSVIHFSSLYVAGVSPIFIFYGVLKPIIPFAIRGYAPSIVPESFTDRFLKIIADKLREAANSLEGSKK